MAALNGRRIRLRKSNGDSPETFTTIAGLVEKTITINNGEIDITSDDDAGRMARLGGGLQDLALSVTGVEKDEVLLTAALNQTAERYRIEYIDTGSYFLGTFEIGSYEITGTTENGAVRFSTALRPTLSTWTFTSGVT